MIKILYTTYYSNLKQLPDNSIKITVSRYPPIRPSKYPNIKHCKGLAPTIGLYRDYIKHSSIDWETFKERYYNQMENNRITQKYLNLIHEHVALKKNDIILICYEKNFNKCHRSLIAKKIDVPWSKKYEKYEENKKQMSIEEECKNG